MAKWLLPIDHLHARHLLQYLLALSLVVHPELTFHKRSKTSLQRLQCFANPVLIG